MDVKQSVFINVSAEEVFAYMTNLENLVNWSSPIVAVRKTSSGAMGAGTTIQSTLRFLGRWVYVTFEVVEYKFGCYLTIKSVSGGSPCLFSYQFEPDADGWTLLSLEAMVSLLAGPSDLPTSVVMSAVRRQLEYDLLTLKDLLEARCSARATND